MPSPRLAAVSILIAVVPASSLADPSCIEYGAGYQKLNQMYAGAIALELAVDGSTAYVTYREGQDPEYAHTLTRVYDMSVRNGGEHLSTIEVGCPSDCRALDAVSAADGIVVGLDGDVLHVGDATDPSSIAWSMLTVPGVSGASTTTAGGLAFLAGNELIVVDVADPGAPIEVGRTPSPVSASELLARGPVVYAVGDTPALHVFDVSEPSSPNLQTSLALSHAAHAIAFATDIVYAVGDGRLTVVDVTDPVTPSTRGDVAAEGNDVTATGTVAILAADELQVVDVSDPDAPAVRSAVFEPAEDWFSQDYRFHRVGHAAVGLVALGTSFGTGGSGNIDEGAAFVYEVEMPSGEALCLQVPDVDALYALVAAPGLVYGTDGGTLHVIDVSNPMQPFVAGSAVVAERGVNITLDGDHLYAADWVAGVYVVDVQDPSNPQVLTLEGSDGAYDVAVEDHLAYVVGADSDGTGDDSFRILDVSTPSAPVILSFTVVTGDHREIVVDGDHAFISFDNELRVMDVSDPTAPFEVTSIASGGRSQELILDEGFLFTVSYGGRLDVIDVRAPTNPSLAATLVDQRYELAPAFVDLVLDGDVLYGAWFDGPGSGLAAYNVSDPYDTHALGWFWRTPNFARYLASDGTHLWSGGDDGMYLLARQCLLPAVGVGDDAPSVTGPSNVLAVWPSPIARQATIRLSTRSGGTPRGKIFDVAGRLVDEVVFRRGAAAFIGSWDASRQAPGTYFLQVETDTGTLTERLVHVSS